MGKLAYEYHQVVQVARGADYMLSAYIDKFGEDLFLELEEAQIEEAVYAIQEGDVTGEDDGVDSSSQEEEE